MPTACGSPASEADAPLTARQTDLRGPLAIVVGSEGQGLGPAVRRRCDLFMRIPMHGAVGSLNAAVAGSVLLFEAVAQRDPGDARPPVGRRAAPAERPAEPTEPPPAESPDAAPAPTDAVEPVEPGRAAGAGPEEQREPAIAPGLAGRLARPGPRRGDGPPARRPAGGRAAEATEAEGAAHPPRLTHPPARPYHSPAPERVICGMALPVVPT